MMTPKTISRQSSFYYVQWQDIFHPSLRPSGPECPRQSAFYADQFTPSMAAVIAETNHRRDLQEAYNREHGITLESIQSRIKDVLASAYGQDYVTVPLAAGARA